MEIGWESTPPCPLPFPLERVWKRMRIDRLAGQTTIGAKGHVKTWGLCHGGDEDSGKVSEVERRMGVCMEGLMISVVALLFCLTPP